MSANTVVPGTEAFHAKLIQCIRTAGLYANRVKPRGAVPLEEALNPTSLTTRQPIYYNTAETLNNFQIGRARGKSEGKGKGKGKGNVHPTTGHEDP